MLPVRGLWLVVVPGLALAAGPDSDLEVRRTVSAGNAESVRIDLQNLLNTRQRCYSWPKELQELDRSVLDYGIPDLTGANLASAGRRNAFLEQIASIIRRHDARFQAVKVQPLDGKDPSDRTLRFRVEAVLRVETEAETAIFDFQIEPVTRHVERVRTALGGPQSGIVLVDDLEQGLAVVNAYAAEHLEIQTENASEVAARVRAAGAIFVGPWAPVSLGDYCAGSNHVLPTAGCARH